MKHWQTALAILTVSASLALADDFKTISGKEYKNAKVSRVEPDGIVLIYKSGVAKVYFADLPKEVQRRFGRDPDKIEAEKAAARAAEDKRIEAQNAADRERAEKEKSADADLNRTVEQFKAAEQRAAENYQNAAKGTLSGQIFVSTKGAENFKLGAVQVSLYARDATDVLLAGLKKYADIKIQRLSGPVAAVKAAMDQAQANEKAASDAVIQAISAGRDYSAEESAQSAAITRAATARQQYREINTELDLCYSGSFYFAFFQSPIRTAETNAEGKFVIQVPRTGEFVIAAYAERAVSGDKKERYYWLQAVSLGGQQQLIQNLSNNNLTSTTGTSALVLTKD